MRLQKLLAKAGIGSRRAIEEMIANGRITVNGKVVELGFKIDLKNIEKAPKGIEVLEIRIDGKKIPNEKLITTDRTKVLLYHKPVGEVCTRKDEKNRATIFANLPKLKNQRWISVGRLDLNSSGLLLLTTDGNLANKLMHPSSNIEREYLVRVIGDVTPEVINKLQQGVKLEDGIAKFKSITTADRKIKDNRKSKGNKIVTKSLTAANKWYKVILTQGKNRAIRRIFATQGIIVNRLIRIRFGKYKLPKDLKPGTCIQV